MSDTAAQSIETFVDELLSSGSHHQEKILQYLVRIQSKFSYIPEQAIFRLSERTGLALSDLRGLIEFYSFLYTEARGNFHVQFSDNIVDRMQGSAVLAERLCARLKVTLGVPRADGRVTVSFCSCIGMSDQGPAALVNGLVVTCLDEERIQHIAAFIEAGKPLESWPAEYFSVANNIQCTDLLLNETTSEGSALENVIKQGAVNMLEVLQASGLRGRGGAGFSTAKKWQFCRDEKAEERYVICNADEGEPGTFKDRVLLQSYADRVIEGMTACAYIVGANKGYIYLRAEYCYMQNHLEEMLSRRRQEGLLGQEIMGKSGFNFDIEIYLGAGAYICGEESALIESLEGKRGIPRKRPPFPVTCGFGNQPTVVNNVETFLAAAWIMAHGAEHFAGLGTDISRGTKLLSISGDCSNPGIYEFPFGVTVRELLDACGATAVQAVQISGPAGTTLFADQFDRKIAFEDVSTGGSVMVFGEHINMLEVVRNFCHFFAHESCGFCTPCRVGTRLLQGLVDKLCDGTATASDRRNMCEIGDLMSVASFCGLGKTAANTLLQTMQRAPSLYDEAILASSQRALGFDLVAALSEAQALTETDHGDSNGVAKQ